MKSPAQFSVFDELLILNYFVSMRFHFTFMFPLKCLSVRMSLVLHMKSWLCPAPLGQSCFVGQSGARWKTFPRWQFGLLWVQHSNFFFLCFISLCTWVANLVLLSFSINFIFHFLQLPLSSFTLFLLVCRQVLVCSEILLQASGSLRIHEEIQPVNCFMQPLGVVRDPVLLVFPTPHLAPVWESRLLTWHCWSFEESFVEAVECGPNRWLQMTLHYRLLAANTKDPKPAQEVWGCWIAQWLEPAGHIWKLNSSSSDHRFFSLCPGFLSTHCTKKATRAKKHF